MNYLSLTDLFLVGLALDICGAVLLAKGLLLSPRAIASLNTFWGINQGALTDRIQNRVYAEFGMVYLATGFALQAVGYGLEIGGVDTEIGTCRLIVALALAAGAAGAGWAIWELRHGPRMEALRASVEQERDAARAEIRAAEAEQSDGS
ncbi:MAG TPA: hypothetical protein VN752_08885 [Solirubrobacterales bacterium]|nr:hypothetical protein [Solirubrobacterales bacterium]